MLCLVLHWLLGWYWLEWLVTAYYSDEDRVLVKGNHMKQGFRSRESTTRRYVTQELYVLYDEQNISSNSSNNCIKIG